MKLKNETIKEIQKVLTTVGNGILITLFMDTLVGILLLLAIKMLCQSEIIYISTL